MLSIIGLTLTVRALLIPLFVKQIKSSRNMQLIQPKVKELQKKYGHDRERLAQETMKLYKDSGTNPFASCLPILIQMPIFLALFRLLDHHAAKGDGIGVPDARAGQELRERGAVRRHPDHRHLPEAPTALSRCRSLAAFLVLAMTATTFTTQRQLMSKNMPADALTGPYAQQQKLLLYVLPVVFAVGGIAFPIGVLFYWTTSNLWTMGQQFYVIRNNPAPGTAAEKAKAERDRAKALKHGKPVEARGREPVVEPEKPAPPRRQQPQEAVAAAAQAEPRVSDPPPSRSPKEAPMSDETVTEEGRRDRDRAGPGDVGGRGLRRGRGPGRARRRGSRSSSRRATSRPTTSRSCSTSPISTATSTWTSTATAPPSRSSVRSCRQLVGDNGEVLEALQELTRLAVYRETGERTRLMLDISGFRAASARSSCSWPRSRWPRSGESGEPLSLSAMTPFERKVVHDAVAAAGLTSESEGVEPRRFVVVLPG